MSELHDAARAEIEAEVAKRGGVTCAIQHENTAWFVVDANGAVHDYPDDMPPGWHFVELRRFRHSLLEAERIDTMREALAMLTESADKEGRVSFHNFDLDYLQEAQQDCESEGIGPPTEWFASMRARVRAFQKLQALADAGVKAL